MLYVWNWIWKMTLLTIFGLQVLRVYNVVSAWYSKGWCKKPFSNSRKPGMGLNLPTATFRAYTFLGFGMRLGLSNLCLTFQFQWLNWSNLPSNSFLYKIQVKMALKLKISRKTMCTCFFRFHLRLFLDFICCIYCPFEWKILHYWQILCK